MLAPRSILNAADNSGAKKLVVIGIGKVAGIMFSNF